MSYLTGFVNQADKKIPRVVCCRSLVTAIFSMNRENLRAGNQKSAAAGLRPFAPLRVTIFSSISLINELIAFSRHSERSEESPWTTIYDDTRFCMDISDKWSKAKPFTGSSDNNQPITNNTHIYYFLKN
jgi:hypothetical protein